jgi:cob(I)alamin adenosyltransferase
LGGAEERAVKIYTKTGDAGDTGLFGGGRVAKDHPRVAAYGDVDELNAAIGVARAAKPDDLAGELLEQIQRDLFAIGAELAAPEPAKLAKTLAGHPIGEPDVTRLERAIDAHEDVLPPLRKFILPGGTAKAAALHLARTVCRRAERAVVTLCHETPVSAYILQYLNRLSDLLFVLARAVNAQAGREDVRW